MVGPRMLLGTLELSSFDAMTRPAPAELGRALETRAHAEPVLQLRFGEMVAGLPISDVWSACCELLLQAQLAREMTLDRFVLDLEDVFNVASDGGAMLCRFSAEHVFAVSREGFASALERLVEQIFSGTSCPSVMHVVARWGASSIRGLPYSYRFSDSQLM